MEQPGETEAAQGSKVIVRLLGPLVFLVLLGLPISGMTVQARLVAGVALWMAVWWVTEAVPLAITSLLPLVLFPLAGLEGVRGTAPNYGNHMIFLFLGGFIIALAVERSGAHRRIALTTVRAIGSSPRRLIWAFLIATAVLSMWLSNTATTLMMLPIVGGVAEKLDDPRAPMRLFLAVAFGASIGGMGTLVGTPPNLVLAGMAPNLVPDLPQITFGGWMLFGVPTVICLLPIAGFLLARGLRGGGAAGEILRREAASLGRMTPAEFRSLLLLAVTAMAWIFRADMRFGSLTIPGWSRLLGNPKLVSDAVPAIAAGIAASMIPSGGGLSKPLVTWDEIRHGIPWGVLLLFGGGFALADGVHASKLDTWMAHQLQALHTLPVSLVILTVVVVTIIITNLTSNTATATLLMPVMAALALALREPPYLLMVAATVAASCAFMLPVATPPNAIVMASGKVTATDMFKEGIRLNVLAALITAVLVLLLGPLVFPMVS